MTGDSHIVPVGTSGDTGDVLGLNPVLALQSGRATQWGRARGLFWGLFNFDDYFFCWGSSETREMITQDLSSSASLSHAWEVWREARGLRRRRKISSSRSNVSWIISPLLTGAAPCKRTGALLDR